MTIKLNFTLLDLIQSVATLKAFPKRFDAARVPEEELKILQDIFFLKYSAQFNCSEQTRDS